MDMEYRKLKATDLGPVCKIISGIGVKEFRGIFDGVDMSGANEQAVGTAAFFGIAGVIIENLPKVQKDINNFMASLTGKKVDEIENMEFVDYTEMLFDVVQKDEFRDFLSRAWRLFNR